ncbi:hypothetical protein B5X24_HaOG209045 [Helicoverpa armigera]|uniref:Carboxypeptidase inhibitor n=1 Tax=Helicoverpa armigera TaxID=29058 RepID=A0A2W1BLL3_HELAM|nr:hypothetical protein B5X24_HaOG209045 [Helicoverpa armigera]
MCSKNIVIVLCFIGLVKAYDDFKIIDSIQQEEPCTSRGGLCTIAADCPKDHLVEERGLCPSQRSRGVECCYGLSVKETRCEKRGGMCLPGKKPCGDVILFKEATDCPKDTKCCILVH